MFNHIVLVQMQPEFHLLLHYDDGTIVNADFAPVIQQGGVFSPLADPSFFSNASLDEHGRIVQWPGELEFCADALRQQWGSH